MIYKAKLKNIGRKRKKKNKANKNNINSDEKKESVLYNVNDYKNKKTGTGGIDDDYDGIRRRNSLGELVIIYYQSLNSLQQDFMT